MWKGVDDGVEGIAMGLWLVRTVETCVHQSGFWDVKEANRQIEMTLKRVKREKSARHKL